MRRLCLVLSAISLLAVAAEPAEACSAPQCWPGAFVPRDGATIPENAPGLYWRPSMTDQAADPSLVRLTRADDPLTALELTTTQLPNGDYVIRPVDPLEAGVQYVLEERTICNNTIGARSTFTAGPAAPLPSALGTVQLIGHGTQLDIEVATAAGSCSTTVDAVTLTVELAEAAAAEPWKDLFLYETLVDDQPWVNQKTINVRTPPGESWRGRGTDLLYRVCTPNPNASYSGLASGGHEIRFRASLPGVATSVATPAQAVELICDTGPGTEPNDDDDGGGCATTSPRTSALAMLAFALLVARGRRRNRA